MTAYLPPNLLSLFAPRDPLAFKEPTFKLITEKRPIPWEGVGSYLQGFEAPSETPDKIAVETREERTERRAKEKAELQAYRIEQGIALWNPNENPNPTEDPYRTLFVANITYEATESQLRKEFEQFGSIKKIRMINDTSDDKKKPRGYAFVEYERERDMHSAYKRADGMKIDGRRVKVDVERGRTVKGWLPRRFGGGVGEARKAKDPKVKKGEGETGFFQGGFPFRGRDDVRPRSPERRRDDRRERSRDRSDRDRGDRSVKRERRDDDDRRRDRDSKRPRHDDEKDRGRERGGARERDSARESRDSRVKRETNGD